MSNLIIMPGDPASGMPSNYAGRTLALNVEKQKKYQTFGFYLGPNRPFAVVPENADMGDLRDAVLRGVLIDVTDQPNKGISFDGSQMSAVATVEDPNLRKVFIGSERHEGAAYGAKTLFVAIPRDDQEDQELLWRS